MKLYDLIANSDDEITVWDVDYDIETYFYGIKSSREEMDEWDTAMVGLSKLLDVVETRSDGVTVNLSQVVEHNLRELNKAKLFIRCNIDDIMEDMPNILAGHVSEEWLKEFVSVLKNEKQEV